MCLIGDGLGNAIEQTAMVKAAITVFPVVDVWCPRSTESTLALLRGLPGARRIWRENRESPPGTHPAQYTAVFRSFLIPQRWVNRLHFRKHHGMVHPQHQRDHESEAALSVAAVRAAGYKGPTPRPYCGFDPFPDAILPGQKIAICTGGNPRAAWRRKRYPHWEAVADYIHERLPDLTIYLVGSYGDDPIDRKFVTDIRGQYPIREIAGLIRKLDAMAANDCGLSHVAAALGVRTFTLFGPTRINKNAPRFNSVPIYNRVLKCRPCQYNGRGIGRYPTGARCKTECLRKMQFRVVGNHILRHLGHEELCDIRPREKWYPLLSQRDE